MARDLSGYTIYLLGHAHIDLAYRWRWNETVHRVARDTFRGVLRLMAQEPELTFVQSQLALYETMQEHYPELYAEIVQRVAEGRWIVVDGWCEYDHTMPGDEAIIRQHLVGSRYAQGNLGRRVTVAWAPDAFSGHMHTMPQILQGCGIECLLFGRGMPHDTPAFWWEGPDGSRILAYSPAFTYSAVIGPEMLSRLDRWEEMTGKREMLVLYGRGDHGGGPREEDMQALAELRAQASSPRFVHTTPDHFFRQVLASWEGLSTYRGELGGGFTGSCSTAGRNKQRNRQAENLLLTAERFATMAVFFQRKPVYPRVDFTAAWKTVLHHQFHDELPGTSRAPVFQDNAADYDRLTAEVTSMLDTALAELGARVDTRGEGLPILVFNSLAWARSEPVQVTLRLNECPARLTVYDANGAPMPTQVLSVAPAGHYWQAEVLFLARDVPPLGYRLFRAFSRPPAEGEATLTVSTTALENAFLRVEVHPKTGHVSRIYDKIAGREVLAGPGNVLQAIAERPGAHSAWIIALTDQIDELATPEAVELVEAGPVRATLRARYRYRDSYFIQDVILHAGLPRVSFRFQAEWYERERCLKVCFPIAVEDGRATFEAPFGHIVRPTDGSEVPAQRWIDLSNEAYGASLLNDCRYAFDVRDHALRMTMLRGAPDLDPRSDEGAHDLRYALYPHAGDWRAGQTVCRSLELNSPLLARQEPRHAGMLRPWTNQAVFRAMPPEFAFLRLEPGNVVLSALKIEEEDWGHGSPIVVRLYETEGRETPVTLTLPADLRLCEETNHLEERRERQTVEWAGRTVHIRLRPYEIKTLRLALAVRSLGVDESELGDEGYVGNPPIYD